MIKKLFLKDSFILGLIIINSLILFIGGYPLSANSKLILSIIDHTVTSFFIIEMVVKFNEYGFKNYFRSSWNKLDFTLIIFSIPSLITYILNIDIIDFSFLLVFRIFRVFKAFRFIKFIPNIGELLNGIQQALKTSVFVLIGFVVYIYIIAILSFYLFQHSAADYFETPLTALYSTFKLFTLEGWSEMPEQITQEYTNTATFFTYIYFIFIVMTGGIFGLSLVNSIFVDSMISDNNDELEIKIDNLDSKISDLIIKINSNETRKDT